MRNQKKSQRRESDWGKLKRVWQLCCCISSELVFSHHTPCQGGTAQVNRCGLLALCWGHTHTLPHTHTHTHTQRCQSPGFGPVARGRFYPLVPQSPWSPAAKPVCSTHSSFLHPSFLFFKTIFIFLLLPGIHLPSLKILFITRIIKPFSSRSPSLPPSLPPLLSSNLCFTSHLHFSFISTSGQLLHLSLHQSLGGGPESSGCSSRMSDRHILTFRQPRAPEGSSTLNQPQPLDTCRNVPLAATSRALVSPSQMFHPATCPTRLFNSCVRFSFSHLFLSNSMKHIVSIKVMF